MKLLPEKFTKKGFKHVLIKREGRVALYKRYQQESIKTLHYEVVVISQHNGIHIEGNYIEPGELYPSTSQWGSFGWTFGKNQLEQAEEKFLVVQKQLLESESKKAKTNETKQRRS